MIADSIKTQIEQHRVRRSMEGILTCLFVLFVCFIVEIALSLSM